jgi:dUTP pyrophosphatase
MKLKIKIKLFGQQHLPELIDKGDFVDLRYGGENTVYLNEGDYTLLRLGVAMKLPKGFEAIIVSRSSTYNRFGIMNPNGFGVIDGSYSGNNDEWKYPALALRDSVVIHTWDRICQFRIQLSQKATVWQKLRWLFSSGIKFVKVDDLGGTDRGGFGSTGKN